MAMRPVAFFVSLAIVCTSLASQPLPPTVYIATSRYIPAAPDQVGICTFTPPSFRYSCNQSWIYHPVGQTGSMAEVQGNLFVACTPQTFYTSNQIAVINTSTAKVRASIEEFESVARLLPWKAGGSTGALVIVDGGIADDGSRLGKGQLIAYDINLFNTSVLLNFSAISRYIATTANCSLQPSASIMEPSTLIGKYWCYGGYTGWIVLDMVSLSFHIFPALNPRFLCNGMAVDSATRSIICTSLGQSTSWLQLISLPLSELGNTSAIPTVLVDNLSSVCGFGQNEQARDLEYDSDSATIYISTQQYDDSHPFDLGHAAYAMGPVPGLGEPPCARLTYFTGDYDMVAQASVAVARP